MLRPVAFALPLVAVLSVAAAATARANGDEAVRAEARGIVGTFAATLKEALKTAVDAGGFENAIDVCNAEAPRIAQRVSADSGWRVGRTALRVRNPKNAPTTEERAVLDEFSARAAAGEPLAGMEHTAVTTRDGEKTFHYMKAIPLAELCTACHGTQIEPGLAAAIAARYPSDQATGFRVGELRGAFTLYKSLD